MSHYTQKEGRRLLAEMLAGSGDKLDTMYVEYGNVPKDPGPRDAEYFDNLEHADDAGVLRLSVAHAYCDDDLMVRFSVMVRLDDTKLKDAGKADIGCITLASSKSGRLFCTFGLKTETRLVKGAYTTLQCVIDMGHGNV